LRAFLHDHAKAGVNGFSEMVVRKSMIEGIGTVFFEVVMLKRRRPAAIRPLGVTGKEPVILERMDAIPRSKTMAGSPDAELSISVPQSCAWFLFLGRTSFREPMKEIRNV
jgi:hypothetical protein